MWISVVRSNSGRKATMASRQVETIPPPGPPPRPERKKKDERRECDEGSSGCDEGGGHNTHKPDFQERLDGVLPQDQRPRVAHTEGSPGKSSNWDNHGHPTPGRCSYRLTGIRNPRSQNNMLPLWLEERPSAPPQSLQSIAAARDDSVTSNENSFETRWDSLRGKNKVHSSSWVGQRPPGWEDVGNTNTRNFRNSYCPKFSIQNIDSSTTENPPASAPPYNLIPPEPWKKDSRTQPHFYEDSSETYQSSRNINHNFADSFLMVQNESALTSNKESESGSNSPASTAGDNESSNITDRHLWASSDSFYCEDFTFCDRKRKYEHKSDVVEQPRSYSQLRLRKNNSENSDEYSQTSNNEEEESYDDILEGVNYRPNTFKHTGEGEEVPDTPPLDRLSLNEIFRDSPDLYASRRGSMVETTHHDNWVQFDGSSLELDTQFAQSVSIQDILTPDNRLQPSPVADQWPSEEFKELPSTTDNHKISILNLKESNMDSSHNYRGRLIRTYSQHGRRASKRVINSVSRRITTQEYGKVPEPKAPMLSRAALTMQCGPGLFEQPNDKNDPYSKEIGPIRIVDPPKKEEKYVDKNSEEYVSPSTAIPSRSFLEPAKAVRVGSLRVPRLPAALVRRSASLNTPKVEPGEVPFQRLHERRPGSFRRAMSGLGALARSFRRKSNTGQKERVGKVTDGSERTVAGASQEVQRSDSSDADTNRPTPQAPRLPRRAFSNKIVESQESNQLTPPV